MPGGVIGDCRGFLRLLFDAAVAATHPDARIPFALGSVAAPPGRTIVVGAGKAAAAMARAVERSDWVSTLPRPLEGLVVTRYGHTVGCERIEVVEAAHPVPDAAGEAAARRILDLVGSAGRDDLVLVLVSGGGSALMAVPAPGLTLADKQAVTDRLLRSGAPIDRINLVRRHLSAIKGGRLAAAAWPARCVGLLVSDVPGDDPATIASGPTVTDTSKPAEALDVLARYGVTAPPAVTALLAAPQAAAAEPRMRVENHVIAGAQTALEAAACAARAVGVQPVILGDAIEGESRDVGAVLAGIAAQVRRRGQPARPPCVLLSGGETTVRQEGERGAGGPNAELALAAAVALRGTPGVSLIACDTDGVDGSALGSLDVAGAVVTPDTLARAAARGLDPATALGRHDAHTFFAALGDGVVTGPTLTNVNDFRAVVVV